MATNNYVLLTSSYISSFRPLRQHSHDSALVLTFDLQHAVRHLGSMMMYYDVITSNWVNLVDPRAEEVRQETRD